MNRCYLWDGVRVYFLPSTNLIYAVKCSIVKNVEQETLKTWTLDEFESIPDIYEELKDVTMSWSPSHSKELQPFGCPQGVSECFCDDIQFKHIEVAFVSECNLKCRFCAAHGNRVGIKSQNLNSRLKNLYFKTLYSIKGHSLDYIRLTDFGEPLFFLPEVKEYIKSLSLHDAKAVLLTTNGTLIDEEFIRICRKSDLIIYPTISLNAYSREQYLKKMGLDCFDRVVDNIRMLRDKKVPFKVSFLIDETSNDEIGQYIPFFKTLTDLGIKISCYPENSVVYEVMKCENFNELNKIAGESFIRFQDKIQNKEFDKKRVSLLDKGLFIALN